MDVTVPFIQRTLPMQPVQLQYMFLYTSIKFKH